MLRQMACIAAAMIIRAKPQTVPAFLATAGKGRDGCAADNGSPGDGPDVDRATSLLDGEEPQVRIRYEPTDTVANVLPPTVLGAEVEADEAAIAEAQSAESAEVQCRHR